MTSDLLPAPTSTWSFVLASAGATYTRIDVISDTSPLCIHPIVPHRFGASVLGYPPHHGQERVSGTYLYHAMSCLTSRRCFQAVAGIAIASARRKLKAPPPPVTQKQLDKFTESLWKVQLLPAQHHGPHHPVHRRWSTSFCMRLRGTRCGAPHGYSTQTITGLQTPQTVDHSCTCTP